MVYVDILYADTLPALVIHYRFTLIALLTLLQPLDYSAVQFQFSFC